MAERVLVARLDALGDVLLAGPAVRAVANGAAHVTMLCSPRGAPAARLLPGVDEVLEWEAPWISRPAPAPTPAHLERLTTLLAGRDFDAAVILTSFHQSPLPLALWLKLAGVPFVAGASVDYAGSLLDVRLRPGEDFPEDLPEAERALLIATAAGFRLPQDDPGLLRLAELPELPPQVGDEPYAVVHPGAAAPSRRWTPEGHAAVVRGLAGLGLRAVVTGGPHERALTAAVAGDAGLDLGGSLTLAELAAVLASAAVAVCGNTGPAHLAAAVGTPVVSIFSPVVPAARWAPYGVPTVLLGDQHAMCRDSRAVECPVPGHPCLSTVTPEEVLDACRVLVSGAADRALAGERTPRGGAA